MSCSPFGIAHVLAPCTTLTKKELYLWKTTGESQPRV
jgi:hypothetical protein